MNEGFSFRIKMDVSLSHIDESEFLEHYGILGMKWGVRRTPEQLGHKPRTPTEKWKVKQLDQIDRLYNKSYKKLDKAYKQDPIDESIMKYKRQLEAQQKKDREKIEKMSFVDVEQAREVEKEERAQKRKETVQAVGGAAMWTAKMALIGVRIGGTVALLNVLGDAGKTAMDFISSPEGQAALQKGGEAIRMFGNGELTALGIAKKFIVGNAPKSNAAKALSTLDVESLMPGANYVSPEEIGKILDIKVKDL